MNVYSFILFSFFLSILFSSLNNNGSRNEIHITIMEREAPPIHVKQNVVVKQKKETAPPPQYAIPQPAPQKRGIAGFISNVKGLLDKLF
jgi:hypothetical protein